MATTTLKQKPVMRLKSGDRTLVPETDIGSVDNPCAKKEKKPEKSDQTFWTALFAGLFCLAVVGLIMFASTHFANPQVSAVSLEQISFGGDLQYMETLEKHRIHDEVLKIWPDIRNVVKERGFAPPRTPVAAVMEDGKMLMTGQVARYQTRDGKNFFAAFDGTKIVVGLSARPTYSMTEQIKGQPTP